MDNSTEKDIVQSGFNTSQGVFRSFRLAIPACSFLPPFHLLDLFSQ